MKPRALLEEPGQPGRVAKALELAVPIEVVPGRSISLLGRGIRKRFATRGDGASSSPVMVTPCRALVNGKIVSEAGLPDEHRGEIARSFLHVIPFPLKWL